MSYLVICELLDRPGLLSLLGRIGPDLLRPDADPDRAYRRIVRSRAPIGRLIMDQLVIAGIGSIYRTEILWRLGIHPKTPGSALDRAAFDRIWDDATRLLSIGVERNAIVTVSGAGPSRRRFRERVNIFEKAKCPRCHGPIQRMEFDGRWAFVCEVCQESPSDHTR